MRKDDKLIFCMLQKDDRVSELVDREYGQTEFVLTDDDGYSHCFGTPTR